MKKISRREFLKSISIGIGTVLADELLVACSQDKTPVDQPGVIPTQIRPANQVTDQIGLANHPPSKDNPTDNTPSPTDSTTTPISPSETPYLVVARKAEPEELVRRALTALGGIERFVPKGANVIVKPNICVAYHTYEYAATTNPWVVGTLVKLCFEAGASTVRVMDNPFGGTPEEAYKISGIAEQVKATGGEMVVMSKLKFKSTDIPGGKSLKNSFIYDDALKADVLINVPIAKHHSLARLTLGMKNMMGLISTREAIHADVGQRLADLTSCIRPALTVVDAVRILMDHGPTGGNLDDVKKLDTVIASPDIVAADSYAATLFGLQPQNLNYIRAGAEMGLGRYDLNNIKIEEINLGA
jgi:uncharacterized protein (DUF362 family)